MPSFRATLFYLIISYKQGLQSSIYQKLKKTAKFVSGFNSFSKEEQALYDKAHISRDIRISALSVIKGRGTKSLSALNEQSTFF